MDLTVIVYATAGLSLLVSAIKVGDWILNADPRAIINAGRWTLIAFIVLAPMALVWLIISGRWGPAVMLAAFMLPVFVQAAPRWRVLFAPLKIVVTGFDIASGKERKSPDPELVRQSIAVLRAYLDQTRQHIRPGQIDLEFGSGPVRAPGAPPRISTDEALDVLGLTPAACAQEIIEAHRRLEQKVNPECGGTHYLLMKINEAKDVLLGVQRGFG